jgi:hypothetical protein
MDNSECPTIGVCFDELFQPSGQLVRLLLDIGTDQDLLNAVTGNAHLILRLGLRVEWPNPPPAAGHCCRAVSYDGCYLDAVKEFYASTLRVYGEGVGVAELIGFEGILRLRISAAQPHAIGVRNRFCSLVGTIAMPSRYADDWDEHFELARAEGHDFAFECKFGFALSMGGLGGPLRQLREVIRTAEDSLAAR